MAREERQEPKKPKKKLDAGMPPVHPHWLSDPEEHDYPAALEYLELIFTGYAARALVKKLKDAPTVTRKAKDIIRASELPLLPRDNRHIILDCKKAESGKKLSPVLLITAPGRKLIIADGYHRCVAGYYLSEDTGIHCRLVSHSGVLDCR